MKARIYQPFVWQAAISGKVPVSTRPGMRRGPAPQKRATRRSHSVFDRIALRLLTRIDVWRAGVDTRRQSKLLENRINELGKLEFNALRQAHQNRLAVIKIHQHNADSLIDSLAEAIIVARRTLGLSAHKGQRHAALAMLQERFVEMPTGEGKTLAVALAAAVSAFDGTPVHIITANDYLADRDAAQLTPFYTALGLSVGCVLPTMSDDARRLAYACDLVYVTGKQVAFDWLRDAISSGSSKNSLVERLGALTRTGIHSQPTAPLLRGLCLAIVDEADSLLIDDARTPVVLAVESSRTPGPGAEIVVALGLAQLLKHGIDFRIKKPEHVIELTLEGQRTLELFAEKFRGTWQASRFRNEHVRQALVALHLLHKDRDYIVREGKVALIDEQSGRLLPDRRLQHGLQNLLELKERCKATPESRVIAAIAFHHFFSRYVRLVGTSGTLSEVRDELACIHRASLVRIPPERASRWRECKSMVVETRVEQLDALVDEVNRCREQGRPILIGTRSVEQSMGVAATLAAYDIPHRVLNAEQDHDEAVTVAIAGEAERVTVATNMAGRGTDIPLGKGVAECGGLHIVSLAFNDARRIDRQLAGRAARQGQPGTFRRIVSLDDSELAKAMPHSQLALARHAIRSVNTQNCNTDNLKSAFATHIAMLLIRSAQRRIERRHARALRLSFESHERLAYHVAIGGQLDNPA